MKWRLSRTLRRRVDSRPIENDDVKYAYAAYKNGALKDHFPDGLDAPSFKQAFEEFVLSSAHAAWVIVAHTKNGFIPIGLVLGVWAGPLMMIQGVVWFPWASKRNITEGTVGFFNDLRKQFKWMGFAYGDHKRIYEVCCMHGIMRRVGTSHMSEHHPAVYEGRNVLS